MKESFGICCFIGGLFLAGNEGIYWPFINLAGVALIIVSIFCMKE